MWVRLPPRAPVFPKVTSVAITRCASEAVSAKATLRHTRARKFRNLISPSPTILRDGNSCSTAYFGKRVAIVERAEHMGGSCINTGTVPSKTLRESALYFSGLKQRGLYGIDYSLKENLTVNDFMHHEREVVDMERQRILKNLALHHIEIVHGQAAFADPHTVAVSSAQGTRQLKGEVILISTGSKPHRPSEIAFDDIHTFDSDTFLQMDRIPIRSSPRSSRRSWHAFLV